MGFVLDLVQDCRSGDIKSWQMMAQRVQEFFTPDMLDKVEAVAPGWRDMASYADGVKQVSPRTKILATNDELSI